MLCWLSVWECDVHHDADWPVRSLKQRTGLRGCVALNARTIVHRMNELTVLRYFAVERMERISQHCRELAAPETGFPFRRPEMLVYESTWRHGFLSPSSISKSSHRFF